MTNGESVRADRLKKLDILKVAGVDAYPARIERDVTIAHYLENFKKHEEEKSELAIAGRIMSIRGHGAIIFVDIYDGTGRIQALIQKGVVAEEAFDLFVNAVDQGDFISAKGTAFTTKRGENSVQATTWTMASKSLMALPSEWYGLKDEEARYRERYVDVLLNPALKEMFIRRSKFWNTIRSFLLEQDFIEVETPILESEPGGADARPFVTHHNALDLDIYLRISAGELWQKRLLVAGFPRVFEIGRIFRNEGMSNEHAQDYTQLEFYQAFSDYREGMKMIQSLYRKIGEEVYGTTKFSIRGFEIDLADEWTTIDYCDIIEKTYGINPLTATDEQATMAATKAGVQVEDGAPNKARIIDQLWKNIRKGLSGPAFLIGVPAYLEPLAKRDPKNREVVERFQVILAGSEMGKGFSELNEPIDQESRFKDQQAMRDAGDEEAQRMDADYIHALEYGMPPAFGFGVSERLFSFLENKSIREAQLFPLLRPKKD
ncbi:MAG: lysyl-tRNA synthetase [Candidatus Parcubacteria bacterium]|jgi:lysyl-tRNA synthetase class 2